MTWTVWLSETKWIKWIHKVLPLPWSKATTWEGSSPMWVEARVEGLVVLWNFAEPAPERRCVDALGETVLNFSGATVRCWPGKGILVVLLDESVISLAPARYSQDKKCKHRLEERRQWRLLQTNNSRIIYIGSSRGGLFFGARRPRRPDQREVKSEQSTITWLHTPKKRRLLGRGANVFMSIASQSLVTVLFSPWAAWYLNQCTWEELEEIAVIVGLGLVQSAIVKWNHFIFTK